MAEHHDDRRQEPRYRTAGSATFTVGKRPFRALVLDLSLNGLKVTRPDSLVLAKGEHVKLTLSVGSNPPFVAEVKLAHVETSLLGLEFYDMPPRDFGVLAGLIEHFQHDKRAGSKPG
jgi:hypothetical protein